MKVEAESLEAQTFHYLIIKINDGEHTFDTRIPKEVDNMSEIVDSINILSTKLKVQEMMNEQLKKDK